MTKDSDFSIAIRARLQADLRGAMKRRDAVEISTLRCLMAALDNAGAVDSPNASAGVREWSKSTEHVVTGLGAGPTEAPRRALSSIDVGALLKREWDMREAAATTLERHGRAADAQRAELVVISRYLD